MKEKIKLLPLLFFYVILILLFSTETFWGDEGRYVMYATNLSHGYYSPQDEIYLWNGPGYPIVLLTLILLKIPLMTAKLLNAIFLFMAIFYFYNTLLFYMQKWSALLYSYILGLYPPFLRYIPFILTEQLTIFLVCGFMFHFCKLHHDNRKPWPQILIASFYLGYLALTKIFFAYVILSGLLLFLLLYLWQKKNVFKKTFIIFIFAVICCLPYLSYTYSLTGRLYYWGNSGGLSLYMTSSPYEGELGDISILELEKSDNHRKFFEGLNNRKLSRIERDDELKKRALENIIQYPTKYIRNWVANIGRLLFNYPYSQDYQSLTTYFYIIPNMFIVVLSVLCIYPTYIGRKVIPYEVFALIIIGLISFSGSSLVFAESRYFVPLVPIFSLWILFTSSNIVKIEIKQ